MLFILSKFEVKSLTASGGSQCVVGGDRYGTALRIAGPGTMAPQAVARQLSTRSTRHIATHILHIHRDHVIGYNSIGDINSDNTTDNTRKRR